MVWAIPADQVSIRGIRSSSIAGVTAKPNAFTYTPTVNQKRIETFDDNGFKTPGLPVPVMKDFKFTVGWSIFSAQLLSLATAEVDEFYTAAIAFATTDDGTQTFTASDIVIDGESINLDPLSDSFSLGFIIDKPNNVTFV